MVGGANGPGLTPQKTSIAHSVLSYYLLIKRIPSAIMGQFALLGPPKMDFGMDNFFYWANIAHYLF